MKKIYGILIGCGFLVAFFGFGKSMLMVSNENVRNLQADTNGPYFKNYSASTTGITGDTGEKVVFDSAGDVGYTSNGAGLSIGKKATNGTYTFTNYSLSKSTPGIESDDGYGVAFDSAGDVGYTSFGGGLSIGKKGTNGTYTFTNFNTGTSIITSDDGYGVAFDSAGDVGYASEGGGLSIGKKSGATYTFTNFNTTGTTGITNNNGFGVAFDSAGDVGYASNGGGLSIGKKGTNGTYTFTNYRAGGTTPTTGITSDSGFGVAFDSAGDVGYGSDGGLSIGEKATNGTYTFTNYRTGGTTPTTGITNNTGRGVAFDNAGDVGYASFGGGLSIGKKATNGTYTFTNFNATTNGITSNNGRGVAFDNNGDVGYASFGGGLSIGYLVITGSVDSGNVVYERNSSESANWNIENLGFDLNQVQSSALVNTTTNNFMQIMISETSGIKAVVYVTASGELPEAANLIPNTPSGAQIEPVLAANNNTINLPTLTGTSGNGFGENQAITIQASYGDSQTGRISLGAAVNITTPTAIPNFTFGYRETSSLSQKQFKAGENGNIATKNDINVTFTKNISEIFSGELNATNSYMRFVIEDEADGLVGAEKNVDVVYVTSDGTTPTNALPVANGAIVQTLNATENLTTSVKFGLTNLKPGNNYRLIMGIANTTDNTAIDILPSGTPGYLGFSTPLFLTQINNNATPVPSNAALAIGLGVGLGLGLPIVAVGSYFIYRKKTGKKLFKKF